MENYIHKKSSNNITCNNDSEVHLNISDSKRNNESSYNEKNLQTEDFNLSNSEINIKNTSRMSKEISGIYSNDVSLSQQSVFRNSVISRNPSIVLNKFQFFSNDENEMDNSQTKNINNMNKSISQNQSDIPNFGIKINSNMKQSDSKI